MEQRVSVKLLVFSAVISLVLTQFAFADEAKKESKNKQLPKSGMLAVSSISGAGSTVVGDVFGGEDIFGAELPPITGSVSRQGEESWRFSVNNNSRDRYSVNVDFVQKDDNDGRIAFSSYSYTLRPGESYGQDVSAGLGTSKAELTLRSYRNLTQEEEERKNKK